MKNFTTDQVRQQRWLFIGDSITDYQCRDDPQGWGYGYVRMIRQWLAGRRMAPEVLNRGISGDTVRRMAARWQEDVIELKPDLLSVKVGVNDVGYHFNPDRVSDAVGLDEFRASYEQCLSRVKEELPECRIVICEPCGIFPPRAPEISEMLKGYIQVARELAERYAICPAVPLHAAFVDAMAEKPEIDWTVDGVHPSPVGDALIAEHWMRGTGMLGLR
ncbi:SGNH/GDSL hydrolase family protein [Coraliomargarita algicola]|uniref:SGNH/GDSL hydrolase family protein n=1 Tax=Coraliomargarita algicola TaxID=3092156 RepID=A0ABZ0RNM9_9BACT|nr:SGNH/GDSL hydrolase family protein [Coraliomargarita sp. J2-16]WPJ96741.1 SGNH/GDSL hydrolase family protein [Coraliomargarita sp. J2-16]